MTTATDWNTLLQHLGSAPRENGSAALDATAGYLAETLKGLGWQVDLSPFTAYPYEHRALGLLLLVLATTYWWAMRSKRFGAAALVALALPLLVWVHFDHEVRVSLGIGAVTEQNVVARLAVPNPEHRLLFSAHYDTKTDLADHVVRSPVQLLALPAIALMLVIALNSFIKFQVDRFTGKSQRAANAIGWVALVYGIASAGVFSGGALLPWRSPGAIDDGAACAVLVRLAEELAKQPPAHTEVELVFFAGEELTAQGSSAFAAQRYGNPNSVKPLVINLDPIGASTDLAVVGRESLFLKTYEPSPEVVAVLDAVHKKIKDQPMPITPLGGLTDGFSFLDNGVPAATLLTAVPPFILPRKLHSSADTADRIVPGALDHTLKFLTEVVRSVDDGKAAGAPS